MQGNTLDSQQSLIIGMQHQCKSNVTSMASP